MSRRLLRPAESVLVSAGVALFLVGTPIAWLIRDLAHGGKSPVFRAVLLLCGILATGSLSEVRRGRLWATRTELGIMLIPLALFCVLAIAPVMPSDISMDGTSLGVAGPDSRLIINFLVIIVMILLGLSQPVSAYSGIHRSTALLGVGVSFMSLAYALSSVNRIADFFLYGRFGGFGDENAPFFMGQIGLFSLFSSWLWLKESRDAKFLPTAVFILSIVASGPMVLVARSRSNIFGALLAILGALTIAFIRRRLRPELARLRKIVVTRRTLALLALSAIALVVFLFLGADYLSAAFDRVVNGITRGASTLLGGASSALTALSTDTSADMRRDQYVRAIATFSFWGHGFNSLYVDDPVLCAFYDLGLVGGAAFVLVTLIIPLKICYDLLMRGAIPPFVSLAMCIYVLLLPNLFLSGTESFPFNWQDLALFYLVAGRYWNRRHEPYALAAAS